MMSVLRRLVLRTLPALRVVLVPLALMLVLVLGLGVLEWEETGKLVGRGQIHC